MEIILDNVTYEGKEKDGKLINFSYTFKNSLTFVYGISAKVIKELLFQEIKLDLCNVYLSERGKVFDIAYLSNDNSFKKDTLYNELIYLNDYYKLNYKNINKKINDALIICNVNVDILNKKFNELSNSELKMCALVKALFLNSKVIILDYFEKCLDYKTINYIKKLLSKLNKMYNKNIIIFSNDIDCYLNIIKDILIVSDGKIKFEGTSKDFYNDKIYKFIDTPIIIDFIKYLDSKGHKFDEYIDIKELLKAIYRDVENK